MNKYQPVPDPGGRNKTIAMIKCVRCGQEVVKTNLLKKTNLEVAKLQRIWMCSKCRNTMIGE